MNQQIDIKNKNPEVSRIGKLLVDTGKISTDDMNRILAKQTDTGVRFGDAAKLLGLISDDDLQYALSRQFDYSYLPSNDKKYSADLVSAYQPFTPQVEALRVLRSQLLLRWLNEGFKAISIVSALSGAGNTFTAVNLAVLFSQLGKRTLIIDANMRYPRVGHIFNIKKTLGLSDILAERVTNSDVLNLVEDFPNLSILTAGTLPPNPQELLGRSNFSELIKYVSSIYDVIIVDTPALDESSDAQIISSVTKGVTVVAQLHHTPLEKIKNLKNLIEYSGATIIGSVVNEF